MLTRADDLGAQADRQRTALRELRVLTDAMERIRRELERAPRTEAVAALGTELDRLHELAGALSDTNWQLRRHGARIGQAAHESRLVSASAVLFDLPRQARQIAQDEGKDITVRVNGLDVRADRSVLHALKDPLTHLMRNAIVHGIETADGRRDAGKAARGRVTVALVLRGRSMHVSISDDGRGIDERAVGERARAMGLTAPGEDATLMTLLTRPGLSTAAQVTELSGRGMGLSIVHEAVRRLGGYVEVSSTPGTGTTFTLSVPSVVARRRLMTFQADGQRCALPLDCVRRVRRVAPEALVTIEGRRVVRDPDGELEAVALGPPADPDGQVTLIEIALSNGTRFALVVDALGTIVDRIIEDAGLAGTAVEAIIGCVLVEGQVLAPVLNPVWLRTLGARPVPITASATAAAPKRAKPTVLIADNSITTRTLEKSLLEARGYHVLVAVDGQEALALLERSKVDVVIADVEMPRTDGFALVQTMKGDSRLAPIPVILVTSLDADSDRRKGLALGADAYIVKQRFDERELVETIEQLV